MSLPPQSAGEPFLNLVYRMQTTQEVMVSLRSDQASGAELCLLLPQSGSHFTLALGTQSGTESPSDLSI